MMQRKAKKLAEERALRPVPIVEEEEDEMDEKTEETEKIDEAGEDW